MHIYSFAEEVTTRTLYAFAVPAEIEELGENMVHEYLRALRSEVGGWQFMQHSEVLIEEEPWRKRQKLGHHSDDEWNQWEAIKACQLQFANNFLLKCQTERAFLMHCAQYFTECQHLYSEYEPNQEKLVDFFAHSPIFQSNSNSQFRCRYYISPMAGFKISYADEERSPSVQFDSLTAFCSCDLSAQDATEALKMLDDSSGSRDFAGLEAKLEHLALNAVIEDIAERSGLRDVLVEPINAKAHGGLSAYSIKLPRVICATLGQCCVMDVQGEYLFGVLSWFFDSPGRVVAHVGCDYPASLDRPLGPEDEIPF